MKKNFWVNKKVLITGGLGFIGSHVAELLVENGAQVTLIVRKTTQRPIYFESLLRNVEVHIGDCLQLSDAKTACKNKDVVLNLAARVGGIEYNRNHQASLLYENMSIGSTMLEAARLENVERFLLVSSACVYPRDAIIPTVETEGFKNEPEPTNGGYGWGKRISEKLATYYEEQYKMKIGIVRPYNTYGPRDHFDSTHGHVIPALISRVFKGENPLTVWGSGKQTRAFLFVSDLARAMLQAIERYPVADPINLGTNEEITIKELVSKIIDISGIKTKIVFDLKKPDGSPRRNSDNTKAIDKIGFKSEISLNEGLKMTIDWYKKYRDYLR